MRTLPLTSPSKTNRPFDWRFHCGLGQLPARSPKHPFLLNGLPALGGIRLKTDFMPVDRIGQSELWSSGTHALPNRGHSSNGQILERILELRHLAKQGASISRHTELIQETPPGTTSQRTPHQDQDLAKRPRRNPIVTEIR
jgi:hypothetical protein